MRIKLILTPIEDNIDTMNNKIDKSDITDDAIKDIEDIIRDIRKGIDVIKAKENKCSDIVNTTEDQDTTDTDFSKYAPDEVCKVCPDKDKCFGVSDIENPDDFEDYLSTLEDSEPEGFDYDEGVYNYFNGPVLNVYGNIIVTDPKDIAGIIKSMEDKS